MLALDAVRVLRRRRLEHGAQRVPEAVVAPPVADAAQHGVPVQRPRAGAGTGGSSPAAARRRRCRRRRRVLGQRVGGHGE
jgi:hypothetical protein